MLLDLPEVGSTVRVRMIAGKANENTALQKRIGKTATVLRAAYGSEHPVYLQFEDGFKSVFKLGELEAIEQES